jgi:hypothetical protein
MFGALGFYSAKGMTVVPSVLGQSQSTAQTNLANANLAFTTTTLNTNVESQGGTVGSQSINSGTLVDYETNVVIGIYNYTPLQQVTTPFLSQSRNSSTTATVSVTNYDSNNSYSISTSGTATFSAGVFSITGITSDNSFSVTVTASRSGFSSNQASISVSSWSSGTGNGGNLSVISTTSSSITVRAAMWNTSSSSITYYIQRDGGQVINSGSIAPFTSQSNPVTQEASVTGLPSATTVTFYLYVNGLLVSTTSGTTGSAPPPVSQTWYCRTYNSNGGVVSQYTSTTDESNYENCNQVTYCRLDGYPTTAVFC